MSMIKELFEYISCIGIDSDCEKNDRLNRKVRLTNQIVLLACGMSFAQALSMIAAPAFSLICFVSVLVYGLTFVLNGMRLYNLSRLYFSLVSCLIIAVGAGALSDGENYAYRIMLIQAFIIPMVVFDVNETKLQVTGLLFFILSFVFYSQIATMVPLFEGIDPARFDGPTTIVTNGVLCMVTLLIGSRYLQQVNLRTEKKLSESLTRSAEEIDLLKKESLKVNDSIRYADQIQKGLLPSTERIALTFPSHFIYSQDATESSGDFYWYGEKNGHIVIAMMESSGFRTTEVMMSIICNMTLERIVIERQIVEPKAIMQMMSSELASILKDEWNNVHSCTHMSVCSIDVKNEVIRFSGSVDGLIVRRGEEFVRPVVTSQNVQTEEGLTTDFYQHELKLNKMNRVYLFTSGLGKLFQSYNERRNEQLDLMSTLIANKDYSVDLQANCIEQAVKRCATSSEWDQDILVFGIEFNMDTLNQLRAGESEAVRSVGDQDRA